MDQFAWSKADALYYMGLLMSVGAVIACVTFVAINPLSKCFTEAKVMIWGGFFFMAVGRAVYIPWGSTTPLMYNETEICDFSYNSSIILVCDNKTELVGCPSSQEWCSYTPAMTIAQFLLGYVLTALGYPIGVTLIQTIFSKILGPRPQVG